MCVSSEGWWIVRTGKLRFCVRVSRDVLIQTCLSDSGDDFVQEMNDIPVLVPPVKIQAPVVFAAFRRPFLRTFFSLGWRSKLAFPPWMVIRSFGLSSCHSLVNSWTIRSGRVSCESRTYWNNNRCLFINSTSCTERVVSYHNAHLSCWYIWALDTHSQYLPKFNFDYGKTSCWRFAL